MSSLYANSARSLVLELSASHAGAVKISMADLAGVDVLVPTSEQPYMTSLDVVAKDTCNLLSGSAGTSCRGTLPCVPTFTRNTSPPPLQSEPLHLQVFQAYNHASCGGAALPQEPSCAMAARQLMAVPEGFSVGVHRQSSQENDYSPRRAVPAPVPINQRLSPPMASPRAVKQLKYTEQPGNSVSVEAPPPTCGTQSVLASSAKTNSRMSPRVCLSAGTSRGNAQFYFTQPILARSRMTLPVMGSTQSPPASPAWTSHRIPTNIGVISEGKAQIFSAQPPFTSRMTLPVAGTAQSVPASPAWTSGRMTIPGEGSTQSVPASPAWTSSRVPLENNSHSVPASPAWTNSRMTLPAGGSAQCITLSSPPATFRSPDWSKAQSVCASPAWTSGRTPHTHPTSLAFQYQNSRSQARTEPFAGIPVSVSSSIASAHRPTPRHRSLSPTLSEAARPPPPSISVNFVGPRGEPVDVGTKTRQRASSGGSAFSGCEEEEGALYAPEATAVYPICTPGTEPPKVNFLPHKDFSPPPSKRSLPSASPDPSRASSKDEIKVLPPKDKIRVLRGLPDPRLNRTSIGVSSMSASKSDPQQATTAPLTRALNSLPQPTSRRLSEPAVVSQTQPSTSSAVTTSPPTGNNMHLGSHQLPPTESVAPAGDYILESVAVTKIYTVLRSKDEPPLPTAVVMKGPIVLPH